MITPLLCTTEQSQIISALPIRFQRMITWYCICLKYHCDDLTRIDQVLDGRVIFFYPSKSGVNGAFDIIEQMNRRYTYDFDNNDFEVCRAICLDEKKRIELRWCNATSHLSKDYLQQRGNYA